MPRPSSRLAGAAVLAATALGAAGFAVPAAADASSSTAYYTTRSVCASQPLPGHAHCFAERRVRVSAAQAPAAHARAFTRTAHVQYGPAGGYTPAILSTAYGVNSSAATTQTVAVIDAYNYPTARADLQTFDARYGIRTDENTKLRIVSQRGSTTDLPVDDGTQSAGDYGWSGEEALDLQAVRGLCHTCTILLVEADSSSSADLDAAVDTAARLGATEISNSYGGAESGESPQDLAADTRAFNHPGVVITASTGDDGMYDWDATNYPTSDTADYAPSSNSPEIPSSLNTVVAVGGTSLQLNDNGTRASESVWNTNGQIDITGHKYQAGLGATGGGCSTLITAQPWQRAIANYAQTACGTKRLAADVSAVADPLTGFDVYDSWQIPDVNVCTVPDCWATIGGTSLASPVVAALWALAGGAHGLKYPSLALYGNSRSAPSSLYDVTAGGNGFCGGVSAGSCEATVGQSPNTLGAGILDCAWQGESETPAAGTRACDAATGYDGPSGVGTPRGLSAFRPLLPTARIRVASPIRHRHSTTLSAGSSTDPYPAGALVRWTWTFGDGSGTGSGATVRHTWSRAGRYTVQLKVTDNYGLSSVVARQTVTVR